MADDALLAKIENYLQTETDTISSETIASDFLKMPASPVSTMLVEKMLGKIPQFEKNSDGLWIRRTFSAPLLSESIFYILYVAHSTDNLLLSYSLWEVQNGESKPVLTVKNSILTQNPIDEPQAQENSSLGNNLVQLIECTRGYRVIFATYHQQRVLQKYLMQFGLSLPDTSASIRTYAQVVQLSLPTMQTNFAEIAAPFITVEYEPHNAYENATLCSQLFLYILDLMQKNTILTCDDLIEKEKAGVYNTIWPQATFTVEDILSLDETPGVYGFKDQQGSFIYVGKANNLRSRLLSYFRQSDESPQKLEQLRSQAVSFITNPCGSDLEALLLEQRLIGKYTPVLNKQIQVHDTGVQSLKPMILLLPSTEEESLQTLWYGPGDTVILKKLPRYWNETTPVEASALESFFYKQPTTTHMSNEKIITTRNLSVKSELYDRIAVSSCANSQELLSLLQASCEAADGSGSLFQ